MNILVLSDLHIDTCDHFGTFQWNEDDFICRLEMTIRKYAIDKVIFNGDVFELAKYRYSDLKKSHPRLISYLENNDFIYIKGNHDIRNKRAKEHYDIINTAGKKIHIEHGHKADWMNGTCIGRFIGKLALKSLKRLSENSTLMKMYYRKVSAHEKLINETPGNYSTLKYVSYALKLMNTHDVVIFGHTHKLEEHFTSYQDKEKIYLNSGTCSLGRFQCLVFDTETLEYEMVKINNESGRLKNYRIAI